MSVALITPDFTKIVPYSPADNNQTRETTVRRYQGNGKELLYINASHVPDTDNPTCDALRQSIEHLKPDRIVIEAEAVDRIALVEAALAVKMAQERGIPPTLWRS